MTPDALMRLTRKIVTHAANTTDDELEPGESHSRAARSYLVDFAEEHGLDDQDFATLCRVHSGEALDRPQR